MDKSNRESRGSKNDVQPISVNDGEWYEVLGFGISLELDGFCQTCRNSKGLIFNRKCVVGW
jgi:hypothetical protein